MAVAVAVWQQIPMLPWLKLSEKGFMVMAFYILHHATLYDTLCREDEGRGQETLSIYLHNIVKIFASRLRLVRLFIVIARAGLGPRAFGNKLCSACLSIYLALHLSVVRPSVFASLTIVFIVSYNFQTVCT